MKSWPAGRVGGRAGRVYGTKFPRWRRFWRIFYKTQDALASLPMLLVTPTVAALFGSAWAASHPSTEVIRHGLVVTVPPSFPDVLLSSFVAGAAGVVVVTVLVVCWTVIQYQYLGGDKDWQVRADQPDRIGAGVPAENPEITFYLTPQKSYAAIDLRDLRDVENCVKDPNGGVALDRPRLLQDRVLDRTIYVTRSFGARPNPYLPPDPLVPGRYEVRFYADAGRRRMHELVCAVEEVKADGTHRTVLNRYQRLLDWLNNI